VIAHLHTLVSQMDLASVLALRPVECKHGSRFTRSPGAWLPVNPGNQQNTVTKDSGARFYSRETPVKTTVFNGVCLMGEKKGLQDENK